MNKNLLLGITFLVMMLTSCSIHPSRTLIITGDLGVDNKCDSHAIYRYKLPPLPEVTDDMTDIQIVDGLADHIELLRNDLKEMRNLCDN